MKTQVKSRALGDEEAVRMIDMKIQPRKIAELSKIQNGIEI